MTAVAHPNIALVKYWGKADTERNLPATGSLSLTLGALGTHTRVTLAERDTLSLNGADDPAVAQRVFAFLSRAFPGRPPVSVQTRNDFPTAAGLASSASGFAAVTCAMAQLLSSTDDAARLAQLAGNGSGSAARSLFGGVVRLDVGGADIAVSQVAAPDDWPLEVVVAVVDERPKSVGSTEGMERTRHTSPYYEAWLASHAADLQVAADAVAARDFPTLARVTEHSCLKMHAVMQTALPALVYWQPASVACMDAVRRLREQDGCAACFTMDAGPQVKVVCAPGAADRVEAHLQTVPGVRSVLRSGLGDGARCVP